MAESKITFDAADDYERFMGRWSRAIGEKFLAWLAPPTNARWLDVGCGTGAFSELIQRRASPKTIVGIDPFFNTNRPEDLAEAERLLSDQRTQQETR